MVLGKGEVALPVEKNLGWLSKEMDDDGHVFLSSEFGRIETFLNFGTFLQT